MVAELRLYEGPHGERNSLDCVEIYMPKSIEFLSELYGFLRTTVKGSVASSESVVLKGFSIYEVDGVFQGKEKLWEQRSLVIRILLIRRPDQPSDWTPGFIAELGRLIASKVAPREEEIWICRYPQELTAFVGSKIVLTDRFDAPEVGE